MFQTTNQWDMWDFNLYLLSSGGFISFHIFPSWQVNQLQSQICHRCSLQSTPKSHGFCHHFPHEQAILRGISWDKATYVWTWLHIEDFSNIFPEIFHNFPLKMLLFSHHLRLINIQSCHYSIIFHQCPMKIMKISHDFQWISHHFPSISHSYPVWINQNFPILIYDILYAHI